MVSPQLCMQHLDLYVITPDLRFLEYKRKEGIVVLGSYLDHVGSTTASMNYRLGQAEKAFWGQTQRLCTRGAISSKVDA